MDKKKAMPIFLSAINKRVESSIEAPTESVSKGATTYVKWGENNTFPDYICSLSQECSTLGSIIEGLADFICGDGINSRISEVNRTGETIDDLARQVAVSLATYNGVALQVIRSASGDVAEVYCLDLRNIRTDEDGEKIYYSENWNRYNFKADIYPKYVKEFAQENSVMLEKNVGSKVYPTPRYMACLKACEIERTIDDFHLNSINNGFMGSYIINFNNGDVEDDIKDEIERNVNEKFAGSSNAGRIMMTFNDSQDTAPTVEKLDLDDFGDKYQSLAKHSRQQIFTRMRANPNLFGIPTENLGFSQEEYDSAFKLFNRTVVRPLQKRMISIFEKIYGEGSISINPFTLD